MRFKKYILISLLIFLTIFLAGCTLLNNEFANYSFKNNLSCKYTSSSIENDTFMEKWIEISYLDQNDPDIKLPDGTTYTTKKTYNDDISILLETGSTKDSTNETFKLTKKTGNFRHSGFNGKTNIFNRSGSCK